LASAGAACDPGSWFSDPSNGRYEDEQDPGDSSINARGS
jgi:hypothetical protein